jgi:predicted ATPase
MYEVYNIVPQIEIEDFEKAEAFSQQVLDVVTCLQDGIRMHVLHVCILASRENVVDSRRYCLSILKRLGQKFPKKPKKWDVAIAYIKVKRKLRGKSNEAILRQQLMTDTSYLAVMQILNVMFVSIFTSDHFFAPLIAIRMVDISLSYGLCSISSIGFAMYSVLSCSLEDDIDIGYKYGQLSIRLLEKFKCIEFLPRVYSAVYGFSASWKNNFSSLLTHLQYAHQVALDSSDLEFAMVNANIFGVSRTLI